ncbi:MAG: DUF805 domain-containing protein [Actinomycetia bacterium]|nr:DUF805 domain-containing protein [Actinomycetes bacterium]
MALSQPLRGASMGQAIQRFFKKYAVFTGRASRSEFWYWYLAGMIVSVVLSALDRVSIVFVIIALVWAVAIIVPELALSVRRLHDTGRSGWWLFLGLIPLVGAIILIVWWATAPRPQGDAYNV